MAIDLSGLRFGRWFVIDKAPTRVRPSGSVAAYWHCRCDCGAAKEVATKVLRNGTSQSCGCRFLELATSRKLKHGGRENALYMTWQGMRARCTNKMARGYSRYGGRGIAVCQEWDDFTRFAADVGERPEGKTLDRINNDGNYEPGNVRWATPTEQMRNTTKWLERHPK